ncbi:MAG TPA: hypothetical protein VN788_07665 [Verrucomicrobiae bacterium]|nr:hypothetical protein [Verrucomicrobiae bacterium]
MRLLTLGIGIAFCFAVLCRAEAIHLNFTDAPGTSVFANPGNREINEVNLDHLDFTGLTNMPWAQIGGTMDPIMQGGPSFDAAVSIRDPNLSAGSNTNAVSATPEPITVAMVGSGLILFGMVRPKRRNR